MRLLLGAEPRAADSAHRLRAMTFALPLTDQEISAFAERFRVALTMLWGLTETCCGGTMMPLGFGARPGEQHIGPAMAGWDAAVVDPDFEALGDDELGELVVRSPGVMRGYYRDPEATAQTLRDGWVRTGDLGRRDAYGYFHFVDRMKDMLKPSGENVAASEIEAVIAGHPAVAECAVVGVPDPVRSEKVVALVVPRPGAEVTPEQLRELCAQRLAPFKVPSIVELHAELPKTSIGKIRKGELRRSVGERHGATT
jgi:acyl-CoA synthetase (AMP-forming)/AMP-acid ligase II